MKRYSIVGRQIGAQVETEICQCDENPKAIVTALRQKITSGRRHLPIYEVVRAIDRQATPC